MNIKCPRCGNERHFITESKSVHIGLYCQECGRWIKWLTNDEYRVMTSSTSEKLKCEYAHIRSKVVQGDREWKIYYTIEYLPVGETEPHIGFGSYDIALVLKWFNEDLEVVNAYQS